jgi:CDGSH-type Zn-finger protein
MAKSLPKKIVVTKDGPYEVSGDINLSMQIITPNKEGFSWDWKKAKTFETKEKYDLCRCDG